MNVAKIDFNGHIILLFFLSIINFNYLLIVHILILNIIKSILFNIKLLQINGKDYIVKQYYYNN